MGGVARGGAGRGRAGRGGAGRGGVKAVARAQPQSRCMRFIHAFLFGRIPVVVPLAVGEAGRQQAQQRPDRPDSVAAHLSQDKPRRRNRAQDISPPSLAPSQGRGSHVPCRLNHRSGGWRRRRAGPRASPQRLPRRHCCGRAPGGGRRTPCRAPTPPAADCSHCCCRSAMRQRPRPRPAPESGPVAGRRH